ncbi:MAG: polyprenyl synthetase family protein [Saprospiraceae bacterium]
MLSLSDLAGSFENYRKAHPFKGIVPELYTPAQYLMDLGGKRIRPISTLVGHQLFQDEIDFALPAALAIEVFHNFSLMHDDIMDESPMRRDHPTVHIKYDLNAAILSGDWMLVHTYELLAGYDTTIVIPMIRLMNQSARAVCEGQQRDINFESSMDVSESQYIDMIRDKTAVLLGAALKMGGLTAYAPDHDLDLLYQTGLNAGISFQLMDDYLDAFGTITGKIKGGDIIQNKKTVLFIQCVKSANGYDREELLNWYHSNEASSVKVDRVLELFEKYHVADYVKELVSSYGQKSLESLDRIQVEDTRKTNLKTMLTELLNRNK